MSAATTTTAAAAATASTTTAAAAMASLSLAKFEYLDLLQVFIGQIYILHKLPGELLLRFFVVTMVKIHELFSSL
jgi:hypothetical protein